MLISPRQLFTARITAPTTPLGRVSQLIHRVTSVGDRFHLRPLPIAAVPATTSTTQVATTPRQQLTALGQKYGVAFTGNWNTFQKDVIDAILTQKAAQYGIPEAIAKAIAGNESNWKMWSDLDKGTVIQGKNTRDGKLTSTDWGVMQINDKAHPRAFPRVKQDLEYNIEYGLQYLAQQRRSIKGSLGLGLGDWDRTVASYNLGHNPRSEKSLQTASRYVSRVHDKLA